MTDTSIGAKVSDKLMSNYFTSLINSFFKILPIRESGEESLPVYIRSLQVQILGCERLIVELNDDPHFITLVSILEYLKDNPDCDVKEVKRQVFRAIDICNKLSNKYSKAV